MPLRMFGCCRSATVPEYYNFVAILRVLLEDLGHLIIVKLPVVCTYGKVCIALALHQSPILQAQRSGVSLHTFFAGMTDAMV